MKKSDILLAAGVLLAALALYLLFRPGGEGGPPILHEAVTVNRAWSAMEEDKQISAIPVRWKEVISPFCARRLTGMAWKMRRTARRLSKGVERKTPSTSATSRWAAPAPSWRGCTRSGG